MPKGEDKIIKTIVYVPEKQYLRLKHLAVDERSSMTELIRQAIDEFLKSRRQKPK